MRVSPEILRAEDIPSVCFFISLVPQNGQKIDLCVFQGW